MRAIAVTTLTIAAIALAGCSDGGESEATEADGFSVRPVIAVAVPGSETSIGAAGALEDAGIDPMGEAADALAWFEAGDCAVPAPEPTAEFAAGCDPDGGELLLLGEALIESESIADVTLTEGESDQLALTFDDGGTAALAEATEAAVGRPAPANRIAMMVDGDVVAAPQVMEAIESGELVIAGDDLSEVGDTLEAVAR